MKKILKYLTINIIIFCVLLILSEIIIFEVNNLEFINKYKDRIKIYPKMRYNIKNVEVFCLDHDYFNGKHPLFSGRLPDGTEYKGEPITIFGCSFAHGQFLYKDQTLSRKLSDILRVPVYNRSAPAQAYQFMYYQSDNDFLYEQVPKSNIVLYVLINDQIRRTYLSSFDILGNYFLMHYDIKDGELIFHEYSNPFENFIRSLYTYKYLTIKYYEHYLRNPKNADKITNDTLLYFVKSRENLEKHWGKIRFYVLFYEDEDIQNNDLLRKKLEDNGFIVFSTHDLTDENLKDPKYVNWSTNHPSEAAWDLLAPIIAEIIEKDKAK